VKKLDNIPRNELEGSNSILDRELDGGKILSSKEEDGIRDLSHREEILSVTTEEGSQSHTPKDVSNDGAGVVMKILDEAPEHETIHVTRTELLGGYTKEGSLDF